MAVKQTIAELTGDVYNELRYNAAAEPITGDYVKDICQMLNKCGANIKVTDQYDETVANAVADFQKRVDTNATGILNNATWQGMIYYASKMSDTIEDDSILDDGVDKTTSKSPHFNPFFDTDKFKLHRQNHKDIKIVLGNSSVIKTIKDVFMRSVSVEVDTSGNPISETYEFIARDIKESDEISDANKYIGNESRASSDIKHIYNFDKSNKNEASDSSDSSNHHGGGAGHSLDDGSSSSSTHTGSSGATHGGIGGKLESNGGGAGHTI